jgi:hypothetical protein
LAKSKAKEDLAEILHLINASVELKLDQTFGDFVENSFLTFAPRKSKRSTSMTTEG